MAAGVALVGLLMQIFIGHIHLAAKYGLEDFLAQLGGLGLCFGCGSLIAGGAGFGSTSFGILDGSFGLTVFLIDGVEKLLDAKHIAMVGDGHSGHTVGYRLVDEIAYRGLAIEERVLRMYV